MDRSVEVLCAALDPQDGPIQRAETHISTVAFQDDWAYKVKRPVRFEFVDLSTPELRLSVCRREIDLCGPSTIKTERLSTLPSRRSHGRWPLCMPRRHEVPSSTRSRPLRR